MVVTETSPFATEDDSARRVLMVHRPNGDDLCAGCLENRAVFAWFPCEQARWALKVISPRSEGDAL
ncbi:hypothetical protein HDA40_005455 [Hamadaea flava]|uniref:Uncharacterized protein n=1 Tax=Hamadaea flava TaxID=1742688 RepID=A0ABV8LZF4_9ACTN|nr:hypothetical protein [Hamadaea flava]MCP2326948.1 hypothetical protein [Hamadaea flava]